MSANFLKRYRTRSTLKFSMVPDRRVERPERELRRPVGLGRIVPGGAVAGLQDDLRHALTDWIATWLVGTLKITYVMWRSRLAIPRS